MFERYTESARRALFFARFAVSDLGDSEIRTEHVLLGLLHESRGLTAFLLTKLDVTPAALRREVEERFRPQEKIPASVEIPFSAETKRALELAADESNRLSHNYIGTEHLLIGLLRNKRSTAAQILGEHGLYEDPVRKVLVERLNERADEREASFDKSEALQDVQRVSEALQQLVPLIMPSDEAHRLFILAQSCLEELRQNIERL
jgi:ATP-dependent Clp protease ATP-binding subunit ClpC